MKEIKNINKDSFAKITALIYGLAGFLAALLAAVFTIINIAVQDNFQGSVILVTLFNIGAGLLLAVLASLFTALCGLVMGYITAAVYNWFAKKVGGIKIELAEVTEKIKEVKQDNEINTNNNQ